VLNANFSNISAISWSEKNFMLTYTPRRPLRGL